MSMALQPRFFLPQLDALRSIAFLLVFLHHAFPQNREAYAKLGPFCSEMASRLISAGGFGVDLFFALSAFLLAKLLLLEQARSGRIDVLRFWLRRLLRIWPLYFAFLVVCFLIYRDIPNLAIGSFAVFLGNWYIASHGYLNVPLDPLWSVCVEEQFYVLLPLALLVAGVGRVRMIAIAFLLVSSVSRAVMIHDGAPHPAIWANTLCRLDPFAAGLLIASVRDPIALIGTGWRRASIRVAVLAAILFVLSVSARDMFEGVHASWTYPLVAFIAGHAVPEAASMSKSQWSAAGRALLWLGPLTYGLYVFHIPMIQLAAHIARSILDGVAYQIFVAAVALTATVCLALLSHRFLERPFMRLKERFSVVRSGRDPEG